MTTDSTTDVDAVALALCTMCQEVLAVPLVSPGDDLFDLDPDSLSLTRLNARVQDTWGVEVPVDVFYDTESILDLARAITTLHKQKG